MNALSGVIILPIGVAPNRRTSKTNSKKDGVCFAIKVGQERHKVVTAIKNGIPT